MSDEEIVEAEIVEGGAELVHHNAELRQTQEGGLKQIRTAIMGLDDARQALADAGDVDGLAYGAADVAVIVKDLGVVQKQARVDIANLLIERHALTAKVSKTTGKLIGRPKTVVPDLGEVEVPGGSERKNWQSERLLRHLMRLAIADPETGELKVETPAEIVGAIQEVLEACLPITASLGWRVGMDAKGETAATGLRAYVDPDDWCDHLDKERVAVIPKRKDTAS